MGKFNNLYLRASVTRIACLDHFITTNGTADGVTSIANHKLRNIVKPTRIIVGRMSRRRYPPNGSHTAEGAALFRPAGFEHVPLIMRSTASHLTCPAKDAGQVIDYSYSTKLPKSGNQVVGYAPLWREFLTYVSTLCSARKIMFRYGTTLTAWLAETGLFTSPAYDFARALTRSASMSPCEALGRDLNF
jgi:hypothetical protein